MGNTESMPPTGVKNHTPQFEVIEKNDEKIVPQPPPGEPETKEPANEENEVAVPPTPEQTEGSGCLMRFGGSSKHGVSDLPESCRGDSFPGRFEDEEEAVRTRATHNTLWLAIVNGYSALLVFVVHLISFESLLSIALSVGMTVYVYNKTVSFI